jgi:hypothetical protein
MSSDEGSGVVVAVAVPEVILKILGTSVPLPTKTSEKTKMIPSSGTDAVIGP